MSKLFPRACLHLLIGREESGGKFHHCAVRETQYERRSTFPYMLSARWRRRASTGRNTTSRENPNGGPANVGKFLSRRASVGPRHGAVLAKERAQRANGEEGGAVRGKVVAQPWPFCAAREIISSPRAGETFIQYPRQHLASNGSARVSLRGFGKCSPSVGGDGGRGEKEGVGPRA